MLQVKLNAGHDFKRNHDETTAGLMTCFLAMLLNSFSVKMFNAF
jgi:hypothetical protein